jgi:S-adenosylmethionine decarboxylase
MHLIIDGYGRNTELLNNEEFIYKFLDEYPAAINMTKISEPRIVRYTEGPVEDWGISGFVFIAESHICIHTFVEQGFVNVDVFSCKDFDADLAIKDIKERLELGELRIHLLNRDAESLAARPVADRSAFV